MGNECSRCLPYISLPSWGLLFADRSSSPYHHHKDDGAPVVDGRDDFDDSSTPDSAEEAEAHVERVS